jgi:hypothetical protein
MEVSGDNDELHGRSTEMHGRSTPADLRLCDRKTMKEFTCGWCTITVCRRCRCWAWFVPVTMVSLAFTVRPGLVLRVRVCRHRRNWHLGVVM